MCDWPSLKDLDDIEDEEILDLDLSDEWLEKLVEETKDDIALIKNDPIDYCEAAAIFDWNSSSEKSVLNNADKLWNTKSPYHYARK